MLIIRNLNLIGVQSWTYLMISQGLALTFVTSGFMANKMVCSGIPHL